MLPSRIFVKHMQFTSRIHLSIPDMMLLAFLSLLTLFFSHDVEARGLNVNAISASNGHSVLECWSLSAPVANFRGAANYPIGDFHGGFIGVIPPRTHIGQAWAAQPQYVTPSST